MGPRISPRVRRNEHTTWISDDAHSRAYQVLFDERSRIIVARLAGGLKDHKLAHEDERCLACHTTPRTPAVLAETAWLNADGVGCEACHGAASRWLGPHTAPGWAAQSFESKAEQGMTNLQDLAARARTCNGCHVGEYSPAGLVRDVNHDLIGAGHPRMNFDFAAAMENMPAHWEERGENAGPFQPNGRAADLPARAWAIGRVTAMLASLELLEARASRATMPPDRAEEHKAGPSPLPISAASPAPGSTPWPEFAEYGCFSCHHDLSDQRWRQRPRASGIAPGAPRWGTWTLPLMSELLERSVSDDASKACTGSLEKVTRAMAALGSNPQEVAAKARETSRLMRPVLSAIASHRYNADEVRRLIDAIDRPERWEQLNGWDDAAQLYLSLVPLRQAWTQLSGNQDDLGALKSRLEEARQQLEFPEGFDSPRLFDPGLIHQRPAR